MAVARGLISGYREVKVELGIEVIVEQKEVGPKELDGCASDREGEERRRWLAVSFPQLAALLPQ